MAGKTRARQEDGQLQAPRLAVFPPAVLGRAVSGRARRRRSHHGVAESELPVRLPELEDFKPTGKPEPPLSKATDWVSYSEKYRRETNTMPQWAGSCWYYLRYIDPHNAKLPWDPEKERYWLPVDLYVGGAEHAVLHLLYSRFWHKVLFDRGLVSTAEPFQKLINQGMILGETEYTAFRDAEGRWARPEDSRRSDVVAVKLSEDQVVKKGEGFVLAADPERSGRRAGPQDVEGSRQCDQSRCDRRRIRRRQLATL